VEAAKKEGKVMLYTFSYSALKGEAVQKGFKSAYGIDVEIVQGTGSVLSERYKTEARAGRYVADIFEGTAPVSIGEMQKSGLLRPLDDLPVFRDVNDPNVWNGNPLLNKYVALEAMQWRSGNWSVNTDMVPAERYPKKWQDFRDPFWKGKVLVADPLVTMVADFNFWRSWWLLGYQDWFPDLWWEMAQMNPVMVPLGGDKLALVRGEGAAVQGCDASTVKDMATRGATNLACAVFDPKVAASPAGGVANSILVKAAHPNAALLFVNWWHSREGQEAYIKGSGAAGGIIVSYRKDVANPVEQKYWPAQWVDHFVLPTDEFMTFEMYAYAKRTQFNLFKQKMTRDAFKKDIRETSSSFWNQYPPPDVKPPIEMVSR